MNFYEQHIIRLQNRIKRIEENPDPTRLKSNKLRYEMELENTREQLDALRQDKPYTEGGGLMVGTLTRAMGFGRAGGSIWHTMEPQKYIELARTMGFPVESSCDMTYMPIGMAQSGDVAKEDLVVCDAHACTVMWLSHMFTSHFVASQTGKKPFIYHFDIPAEENDANLKHVADQIGEFIEFAEKAYPGVIKYDEDKLIEMQYYEEQSRAISNEVYDMLKHKPAPIAGKDGMGRFGGMTAKGLEYAKARRDEIAERVEKGLAAVPGEKLRVLWTVTRPTFMDEYKVLAKWGIAVFKSMGGGGEHSIPPYFDGRKLTPLEKVAARAMNDGFGCPGYSWIDDIIRIGRDLQIDAVINYNMLGCTATLGLKKMVEDAAEKELGIPTLQLEGKQIDDSYANEAVITAKLDEFAQMLLSMKNLN